MWLTNCYRERVPNGFDKSLTLYFFIGHKITKVCGYISASPRFAALFQNSQ